MLLNLNLGEEQIPVETRIVSLKSIHEALNEKLPSNCFVGNLSKKLCDELEVRFSHHVEPPPRGLLASLRTRGVLW